MGIFDRFKKEDKSPERTSPERKPDFKPDTTGELKDFHPYETGLAQAVQALSDELRGKGIPWYELAE